MQTGIKVVSLVVIKIFLSNSNTYFSWFWRVNGSHSLRINASNFRAEGFLKF